MIDSNIIIPYLPPLFFLLLILGFYCIYKTCQKIFGIHTLLEMSYTTQEKEFTINKTGKYSIWQKGKRFTKTPINQFTPKITNISSGEIIPLDRVILRVQKSDYSNSSILLFNFKAEEGAYNLSLEEGSSISKFETLITNPITTVFKNSDPAKYFILIKPYMNPLWIFAFVWSILLSIGCLVGGIISLTLLQ